MRTEPWSPSISEFAAEEEERRRGEEFSSRKLKEQPQEAGGKPGEKPGERAVDEESVQEGSSDQMC